MSENAIRDTRQSSLGWMIQRLAAQLDRDMSAALAPLDLTQVQFAVLMAALEEDGQSQAQIGGRFGQPAYAISRALDALEQAGLIERRANPQNRRALRVHVTENARALAPQLIGIVARVNAELTRDLSDTETAQARALLHRLLPERDRL